MKDNLWVRERRNVVLAFWATVLLGIPCWYLTTQVSRATLPLIPTFEAIRPAIPVALQGISSFSTHKLVTGLNLLQDVHKFVNVTPSALAYTIDWSEGSDFSTLIEPGTRNWKIASTRVQSQNLEESIMAYTLKVFEDERQRLSTILDKNKNPDLRVVKYNPSYEIVLSIMHGDNENPVQFDNIQQHLEKRFLPILKEVAPMANFSLESQSQFHADLTFSPEYDDTSNSFVLQSTDLKNFINSAEWNLASAQSDSKPLNFVVYVPEPRYSPLVIHNQGQPVPTNSFVLPQFGTVLIYNPKTEHDQSTLLVPENDIEQIMEICSRHFLTLLGMPSIPGALGEASIWRVDGLIRQRLVETILSAQETLLSIPKIVDQIPNMHVPAHVATRIEDALLDLGQARYFMNLGRSREALHHSRLAIGKAEQAFFDEKMVSLLYFPDEHKYGVYMPLFGPLLLPLLMAGVRELKLFLQKKKKLSGE
ncbi:protein of unknown function [Taphrina deformans PYCC 5710]|uniref:GPI transamidase component PIG-S n=1 Tax=Taphrina deformans (strain PYCC 5710 / ATCC 11124 / CBS 356.35 / IMI 108563 / JCM 9778 / NBRC 8474) TaxID=1097556 RepID=R4XKW4_TAPDE|nr:protein of unknown function [Taphrina deformans PYCC 5710]|eukprot:CCG83954.1 protein of unknown function [Taphrina deformans PYCC 5710]